jgi:hypothetical protein
MSLVSRRRFIGSAAVALASTATVSRRSTAADVGLRKQAAGALGRAAGYYRQLAVHGGYVWSYSQDLADRRGETKTSPTQIWIQPPGTPSVGQAFLRCYQVTRDAGYLDTAQAAADALAYGQLDSGGWHYMVDFDPGADKQLRRAIAATLPANQRAKRKNVTTFDDDTTQAAVRFLLAVTRTPDADQGRGRRVSDALGYALAGLLRAQYPNGAFPQAYTGQPRNDGDFRPGRAQIPKDWRELPRVKEYWFHYTLNDHTHGDCVRTLLEAHRATGRTDLLDAAKRAGDFLLLAQLPDPQPAWAQQYTPDMHPAWARKFEPPAVASVESVGVCRTLIGLHLATGEAKYLEPIPGALAWLAKVRLPDGRHARFYELGTDRPLYTTRAYEVTYKDDDLPTHYGFQVSPPVDAVAKLYDGVKAAGREAWLKRPAKAPAARSLEAAVREAVAALDAKGRWLDPAGRITSQLFVRNAGVLCDYLAATGEEVRNPKPETRNPNQ